jgi:DNA (cytosine-5)-methyltransferase 1
MDISSQGLRELSLFSGAGGGLLASLLLGWRTVCYVEHDAYCQRIIQARIRDGLLHDAPIWDDVRTFDGRPWFGSVDIVTAGFPCQPFSSAGDRLAEGDERNMWPDTIRIIKEVRPQWCLLENVSGLLSLPYIRRVFIDLAQSGYDTRWDCLPASIFGAPHQRYRLWIVAHAHGYGLDNSQTWPALTDQKIQLEALKSASSWATPRRGASGRVWLVPSPGNQRKPDGIPHGLDRIRVSGNAQVPTVARAAWRLLGGKR